MKLMAFLGVALTFTLPAKAIWIYGTLDCPPYSSEVAVSASTALDFWDIYWWGLHATSAIVQVQGPPGTEQDFGDGWDFTPAFAATSISSPVAGTYHYFSWHLAGAWYALGPVNCEVEGGGGPPVIGGISVSGNQVRGGSGWIEIYGSNLATPGGPPVVEISGGGVSVEVSYWDPAYPDQVNVTYGISASASTGIRSLRVYTSSGTSNPAEFAVGDLTPEIQSVITDLGSGTIESGGTKSFTAIGVNFGNNPSVTVTGPLVLGYQSLGGTDSTANGTVTLAECSSSPCPAIEVKVISSGFGSNGFQEVPGPTRHNDSLGKPVTVQALPPPTLLLTANGSSVSGGQTVYITPAPQMPSIQAQLVRPNGQAVNGSATFQLVVSHQSTTNSFPASPQQVSASQPWTPPGIGFVGGEATIYWSFNGGPQQSLSFHIRGQNPATQTVSNMLSASYWFATGIARQESQLKQFSSDGTPLFGPPNGWGIMQLDPPDNEEQKWNWQANVQAGLGRMQTYVSTGQGFWQNQLITWNDWNANNPGAQVAAPNDRTESACTFTYAGGGHSFGDAISIKRYNGASQPAGSPVYSGSGNYLSWNPISSQWNYQPLNVFSLNYVASVCSNL